VTPGPRVEQAARRWVEAVHRALAEQLHYVAAARVEPLQVLAEAGTLAEPIQWSGMVPVDRVERRRTAGAVSLMLGRAPKLVLCIAVPPDSAHPLLASLLTLSGELFNGWRDQQHQREELRALAHEVRNPLMLIAGYAELLGHRGEAEVSQLILDEVRRADDRVEDLLSAGRPLEWAVVEVAALVERVARRYERLALSQGVRIVVEVRPAAVLGDVRQLEAAVTNLVKNALEAMPAGGRLTLRCGPEGAGAEVVVEDTGAGVAREVADHLFQPYVSTKSDGHGLGLSSVAEIAHRHGGEVRLMPSENGAVFRLWVPRGEVPPAAL